MQNSLSSEELFAFLNELGDEARTLALMYFRAQFDIATKPDSSPVTDADRAIERRVREIIARRFPRHNVFGEEEGGVIAAGTNWVIDPIDGTKSFIAGVPLFGTLVAMVDAGLPTYGMIEMPALRERWIGDGRQTLLNGQVCKTSSCGRLREARLCTTDPYTFRDHAATAFKSLARSAFLTRYGTDCYGYALLASGHIDLVVETELEVFDVMALVPVVRGAGGVITTWSGAAIDAGFDGTILAASTPELHAEAVESIAAP